MAATDGQIILAASRFGDTTPVYLRDFSKQQLPAVAKIIKGHHQNLGVPTLSAPSLQSTALFLSAGKKYQILAQPIKIKEGRKSSNVGCKVLIPETYPGYFELLSEDGRSTRCIDSVLELSKRRNTKVLVRETFRCTQINRTIQAGEMLTTVNENGKYLQCKNIQDEIINLPLETKAKFSQIAKEDSISGVHSVKNLLLKRMPVIVRLVHGSAPKGLKQPFVPELRLLGCVESDRIFALPLQKDTDLISVPLNAKIKLQRAKNTEQLQHFIEYSRFLEKAQRLLADERNRLQVIDIKFSEKEKKDSKFHNRNKMSLVLLPSTGVATGIAFSSGVFENGYVLRKSASCDSYSKSSQQIQQSSQIADEYNEIDHIYDYVRGLTPLSKSLTRFEPICESPTLKSQTTTDSSNSNYCSLIRLTSTINCNGTINNNNNNNINNNLNTNSGYTYNNNHSSLESSKQTVGSHHSGTNLNHSQSNHNPLVHQQQHHHHHNLHQHAYCQNQPQIPIQNTHLPTSVLANATGASGTSVTPITPTIHHYNHNNIQEDIKPLPPPIETIPGKKLPEKRQRPTLPKLYVKNNNNGGPNLNNNGNSSVSKNQNYHSHHHYHNQTSKTVSPANQSLNPNNSNSPLGAAIPNIGTGKDSELEPQSPLFHIRYKSLSNLQLTPDVSGTPPPISVSTAKGQPDIKIKCHNSSNNKNNSATHDNTNNINQYQQQSKSPSATGAREGTLESSRSGGRTSGESKLPEKKTRRLSRPRSLSNLVWDLKPSKEKSKKKLYIHHFDHRQQSTLYL